MRLFVALDIPDRVRAELRSFAEKLKSKCRDARWPPPENFHVTLKFIGHIDQGAHPEQLEAITAALARVASETFASANSAPVELHFRGIGFFPNDRQPRVFWCGLQASPNLFDLAATIERALVPLGIAAEARAFAPHLTLARLNGPCPRLVSAVGATESPDFGASFEAHFHLFESITKPSGAEYKHLQTFSFAKAPH